MSFVQRSIEVAITLGIGNFGDGKGDTVTLTGYQVHAEITKGGAPSWDAAQIRVWGVSASLMNQLTRLGKPLAYPRNNTVVVTAGDADSGMSQVFSGTILTAYGDFDAVPDVCLFLSAIGNIVPATQPAAPLSFPGSADVSVIASQIAQQMGLGFVNDGVATKLSNQYLAGSSMQQLQKLADAGNFNYVTNGGGAAKSLEIWPKGEARGAMGPLIGPLTGLVGYPKYSDAGVMLIVLYMPGMGLGTAFTLKSSLQSATGTWFVLSLEYELECLNPKGSNPWFMHIEAQRASFAS